MRSLIVPAVLAGLAGLACAPQASARSYVVGSLKVTDPWSRATPPGARTGAGYLTVTNAGKAPETLLGAASPAADKVEAHLMSMAGGVMSMRPVSGGLAIAPGATVELKPGGYHLMLIGLKAPLKPGDRAPLTLNFARAGKVQVELAVGPMGAPGPRAGRQHDAAGAR